MRVAQLAKNCTAKDMFVQESRSWMQSEQLALSQNVRLAQGEQFECENSMASQLEQQAELRHIQQIAELRHVAQLKFQEQETRTHTLEEELVRLQGELIRSAHCQAPVGGGGGVPSAVIDDSKAQGTIVALQHEVGAAQDRK